jgi:hypothetical protein
MRTEYVFFYNLATMQCSAARQLGNNEYKWLLFVYWKDRTCAPDYRHRIGTHGSIYGMGSVLLVSLRLMFQVSDYKYDISV